MFSEEGYLALTTRAAVVRRGDRGVLQVNGADRLEWLQGLLTNDVVALPVGNACDAAYLTPQGRMICDMRVVNLADRTLLDVPASLAASLQARLDALIFSEDAQIVDRTSEVVVIDVHGPLAPEISQGLPFVRDEAFGVAGLSAFVAVGESAALVAELVARGAIETTLETLDLLRIEAGRPAFLVDMDEHTIPLEAGLERRAISFSKGCYVGQEVIVRVTQRGGGRVARKLVGLTLAALPKTGAAATSGGRPVGKVTSAAWSPALGSAIALATLHRDFVSPGTVVEVDGAQGPVSAIVAALPFISRQTHAR